MSDDHRDISDRGIADGPGTDETPAVERRDARIERLERALAEEREHSAELRRAADELRFKNEVLEKSYSKQLEDARLLVESAEQSRAGLAARVAELDAARLDSIELLEQAKTEIDRLTAERNQRRRRQTSPSGPVGDREAEDLDFDPDDCSIDDLMDDDSWLRRAGPGDDTGTEEVAAGPAEAPEPGGDMIDPDLVFARGGAKD